jgi:hypothetical protein
MEYVLRVQVEDFSVLDADIEVLQAKYSAVETDYDEETGIIEYIVDVDDDINGDGVADDINAALQFMEVLTLDERTDAALDEEDIPWDM